MNIQCTAPKILFPFFVFLHLLFLILFLIFYLVFVVFIFKLCIIFLDFYYVRIFIFLTKTVNIAYSVFVMSPELARDTSQCIMTRQTVNVQSKNMNWARIMWISPGPLHSLSHLVLICQQIYWKIDENRSVLCLVKSLPWNSFVHVVVAYHHFDYVSCANLLTSIPVMHLLEFVPIKIYIKNVLLINKIFQWFF